MQTKEGARTHLCCFLVVNSPDYRWNTIYLSMMSTYQKLKELELKIQETP